MGFAAQTEATSNKSELKIIPWRNFTSSSRYAVEDGNLPQHRSNSAGGYTQDKNIGIGSAE
jgi:hypothetical protein